jgi:antitoxin component of MazEF toxin-antitoxin module
MDYTLKINARNDVHLPSEILRKLNIGEEKILKAEIKDNSLVLIPVDLEPRYSAEELEGLAKIHDTEKKKGWKKLRTKKDIDDLLK